MCSLRFPILAKTRIYRPPTRSVSTSGIQMHSSEERPAQVVAPPLQRGTDHALDSTSNGRGWEAIDLGAWSRPLRKGRMARWSEHFPDNYLHHADTGIPGRQYSTVPGSTQAMCRSLLHAQTSDCVHRGDLAPAFRCGPDHRRGTVALAVQVGMTYTPSGCTCGHPRRSRPLTACS